MLDLLSPRHGRTLRHLRFHEISPWQEDTPIPRNLATLEYPPFTWQPSVCLMKFGKSINVRITREALRLEKKNPEAPT